MMRKKPVTVSIILSLFIHAIIFIGSQFDLDFLELKNVQTERSVLKIRRVGEAQAARKDLLFMPQKQPKPQQDLSFKQMAVPFDSVSTSQSAVNKNQPKKMKLIRDFKLSEKEIKRIYQDNNQSQIPFNAQRAFEKTDIAIKLEVPKGIPEDELNKHELVFYSFQKRTVMAYINSFFKELNDFELKNPHLAFPMTRNKEKVAGRITYDKNGDILKIDTLKWSEVPKLQGFFMQVLQNMSSLPNPPKEIIRDDTFAINFVLTLN